MYRLHSLLNAAVRAHTTEMHEAKGYAKILTAQPLGIDAELVTVEADLSRGLHTFSIVGMADKAVGEARDRISSAIKNAGFKPPKATNRRIVLSLSPASLRKDGSQYDLPLAVAYLVAAGFVPPPAEPILFCGELGLDGSIRPVRNVLAHARCAKREGITALCIPQENAAEACLVDGVTAYPASRLMDVIEHLRGRSLSKAERNMPEEAHYDGLDIWDVLGQETAKRALLIAAAGRHNLMLYGPPGTGKTMLARSLPSILPPLTDSEMLEATAVHSAAGELPPGHILRMPPFRSPHHTASASAMVGGGSPLRPGEATLAHTGVLFMDEFIEFETRALEALRQPLEDKVVTISRADGSRVMPADFMLVAAMNPAGTLAVDDTVIRQKTLRQAQKLSRPIMERIDLWVEVPRISLECTKKGESSASLRSQVVSARNFAKRTNSIVSAEAERALVTAAQRLDLSPRSHARTMRIAHTIANLAGSRTVQAAHVVEALHYRPRSL